MEKDNKIKIGIMGGTFDPVHYGHLLIAQTAADEFGLDQVLFIPTGKPPHKDSGVTDSDLRCRMVQEAIADNPLFQLSRIEIESPRTSYTYETLEKITGQYPDTEIFFIMGEDSLKYFETWKYPQRICDLATLLIAGRDPVCENEMDQYIQEIRQRFQGKLYPLHSPNYSVSSNEIRRRVLENRSIRYLVPERVELFIRQNHLYQ